MNELALVNCFRIRFQHPTVASAEAYSEPPQAILKQPVAELAMGGEA